MAGIRGVQGEQSKTVLRVRNTPAGTSENVQYGRQTKRVRADTIELQKTPQTDAQAGESFGKFLNLLQQAYPELHIVVSNGKADSGNSLLSKALGEMGDGYALLLSSDFMESLGADGGSYRRKAQAILEVVKQLGRYQYGAAAWMGEDAAVFLARQSDLQEESASWFQQWGQRQEESLSDLLSSSEQEQLKLGSSGSTAYQTSAVYSRLAGAKTKLSVQLVTSDVRRNINYLKMVSSYGDDELRAKAKKALKSLERLLLLANRKMQRFDEERLTDARRKRAQENQQREREKQAALELKRRKTARATGDGAILTEGRLRNVHIPGYRDWAEEQRLKKLFPDPPDVWPIPIPVVPAGAGEVVAAGSGAGLGGFSVPAGFQVADVITF